MPALSWPNTTFPSLWAARLGQGGEQAWWALTPWGWNPVPPSLAQVLRTGGWPKRLGQDGRQQLLGV